MSSSASAPFLCRILNDEYSQIKQYAVADITPFLIVEHPQMEQYTAADTIPILSVEYSQFKNCTASNTVSVDSFLWDEADVDELCDEGKLPRNICLGDAWQDLAGRRNNPSNSAEHNIHNFHFLSTRGTAIMPRDYLAKYGQQNTSIVYLMLMH